MTGSAGFIGRHMARELRTRGWDVHERDLVDGQDALRYFDRGTETLDLVVHAAAAEPHRAAIDGNALNMVRNLHLDSAMFSWAVATGTRVLYLSSSAAYPVSLQTGQPQHGGPVCLSEDCVEDDPDAAYGWTKLTGEKMAAAAGEHIPVHIVRPFSGYGEDQGEDWPFGAFAARVRRRDDPFVIWGDGTQVRDWVHVDDVVAGALAVVEADVREPVNLCTGVGVSMVELAGLMCSTAGYRPAFEMRPDKPAGVAYRVGNPTRFHEIYTPRVDIEMGVKRCLSPS